MAIVRSIFDNSNKESVGGLGSAPSIRLMVVGDSIGAGSATGDGATTYKSELAKFGIEADIEDAAQGGKRILGDFWNLAGSTIGAEYTDEITNNANVESVTDIVICLGTNDVNLIAGAVNTKAEFKTAFQGLIDYMWGDSDLVSLRRIYIRPLGRHATQSSLGFQTGYQSVREVHTEIVDENENVFLMPSYAQIDIDGADTVHPDDYPQLVTNEAAQVAHILGVETTSNVGMDIASAVVDDLGVLITYTLENGNDITVPSTAGDGVEAIRIFDGSTELSYDEIERVSNNQARLKSGSPYTGSDLKVINMYGSMYDLGFSDVPMVKDNSQYTLPARAKTMAIANSDDTILSLTGLKYYMKPSMGKSFTSGTNFNEIKSVNGGTFTALTNDFDYDSTAFGGNGGIIPTNSSASLRGDGNLMTMTGGNFMIGLVVEPKADSSLFSLGSTSFGAYGSARFYIDGGDMKSFRYDGSPNIATFDTDVIDEKLSIIVDAIDNSTMKVYVNSASNVYTVDPRENDFYGWNTFFLNATTGNDSTVFGMAWGKNGSHSGSDPSIADILTAMNNFKAGS